VKQKFNVGDKVVYNTSMDTTIESVIIDVKQYYTIDYFGNEIDVSEDRLDEYKPDLSEATLDHLVQELYSRGFDRVELNRSSPWDMIR